MVDSIKNNGVFNSAAAQLGKLGQNQAASGNDTFATVLKDSIEKVNKVQGEADQAIQGLAKGEVKNIHDTMIAIEKANLSFNLMLQVRNKLLAAYEEVMRTQV